MQERRVSLAMLGYIAGALSIMMMLSLEQTGTTGGLSFFFGCLFFLFFNVCVGFFFSSSAHLFLELTTGKGKAAGLFVLLGLSEATKTLLVAFAISAAAFPALLPFRALAVFLVFVLQAVFIVFIMQRAYGLSKISTFVALLVSFVPSIISLLSVGMLFIWFVFWLIFK